MLGVDADTVLAPHTLEDLERELEANPKVGGVMARYTFDTEHGATKWARLLIRLQRMEFAAWTLAVRRRLAPHARALPVRPQVDRHGEIPGHDRGRRRPVGPAQTLQATSACRRPRT